MKNITGLLFSVHCVS